MALGTVYTADEFRDEKCSEAVVVEQTRYYDCDGVWHKRAYSGGDVVYMVVEKPQVN